MTDHRSRCGPLYLCFEAFAVPEVSAAPLASRPLWAKVRVAWAVASDISFRALVLRLPARSPP